MNSQDIKSLIKGFNPTPLFLFNENNHHFIFDGESLALVKVNQVIYDLIKRACTIGLHSAIMALHLNEDSTELQKIMQYITQLKNGCVGFCPSSGYPKPKPKGKSGINEYYIGITHDCNLSCHYCYVHKTGPQKEKRCLTEQMALQIIDWIYNSHQSGDQITIVLWGGEPLLNWDVFQTLVTYARDKAIQTHIQTRFATTTNAMLLSSSKLKFLAENRVSLNISIDGDQSIHDRYRRTPHGKGTYAAIQKNLREINQFEAYHPIAHITLTRDTLPSLYSSARSIQSLGIPIVIIKPVDYFSDLAIQEQDCEMLYDQLSLWRTHLITMFQSDPNALIPQLKADIAAIQNGQILEGTCNAGVSTAFMDTDGTIHACYNLIGGKFPTQIGHIDHAEVDHSIQLQWLSHNQTYWKECQNCPFKFICGGGCIAKSIFHQDSYPKPSPYECRFNKIFQEHRLRLYAALGGANLGFGKK